MDFDAESFHRLAKVIADSGEASTLNEADRIFSRYGVRIILDASVADNPCAQLIALTAINASSRSFRGNIDVVADRRIPLAVQGFEGKTIEEFLSWVGVSADNLEMAESWPTIYIGTLPAQTYGPRVICPWTDGWRFGIGGEHQFGNYFPPACVAAAGLAVSEAFSLLRGDNPYAGRRHINISLWPTREGGAAPSRGPDILEIPSSWLVGLGHLGQAYAWTLGFMRPASGAILYLQDVDRVTKSTLSTSILSSASDLHRPKARLVSQWLEARGYQTALVERRFDEYQRVSLNEPGIAIFGVDNAAARRVVEETGFRFVIDAGLGSGYQDFRAIRLRMFPGPSRAATLWASAEQIVGQADAPAYRALIYGGAEPCGVTTLASRAVGAPFVGCVAAGYVIAEFVLWRMGLPTHAYVDLNLRNPERIDSSMQ